ncbi:VOC family protein [Brucepastera parasyntrophica]|uniref:VOC family protein n=1 Tax=Brucepastera parasyntrophica TaxID=2880008 RepID=UPI00210A236D|nr:VOC family protein [Brucepastera parasyntrophica]ULQ59010.1 VOC family protein [Brucepastera parasyntrophica]
MKLSVTAYVKGSKEAVRFYTAAFEAELGYNHPNDDDTYMHTEIVKDNQVILAVSENGQQLNAGDTMQFGLNLGNEESVRKAYDVLSENAKILFPIGTSFYNELMFDLVDKYGIRWCIAV